MEAATVYLAGDLGGTKTLLRLFATDAAGDRTITQATMTSRDFDDFTSLVATFLRDAPQHEVSRISRACFAVAGPIEATQVGQRSKITNLPWALDNAQLAAALHIPAVELINDFVAVGYGVSNIAPTALAQLQRGEVALGAPKMVLGAGTGLGVCQVITTDAGKTQVIGSEGGHTDFAPNSEIEMDFLRFMWRTHEHVSYDRILAGSGLVALFTFLADRAGRLDANDVQQLLHQSDSAAAISLAYDDEPLARAAVDMFMRIYGAQAGNLALINLAFGGVYIAGGIAPKMMGRLEQGLFIEAFRRKGRMARLLERMPVHVVLDPAIGLHGAQVRAKQ